MNTLDTRPLFHSTIGFDRFMDLMTSASANATKASTYPPYNIEKLGEDTYRIIMAVAGFSRKDLSIVAQENTLLIKGVHTEPAEKVEYLHRGIATRAFEKSFQLADFIKIKNASLKNGLLSLDLKREVPEENKPREISITDLEEPSTEQKTIETQADKKPAPKK